MEKKRGVGGLVLLNEYFMQLLVDSFYKLTNLIFQLFIIDTLFKYCLGKKFCPSQNLAM